VSTWCRTATSCTSASITKCAAPSRGLQAAQPVTTSTSAAPPGPPGRVRSATGRHRPGRSPRLRRALSPGRHRAGERSGAARVAPSRRHPAAPLPLERPPPRHRSRRTVPELQEVGPRSEGAPCPAAQGENQAPGGCPRRRRSSKSTRRASDAWPPAPEPHEQPPAFGGGGAAGASGAATVPWSATGWSAQWVAWTLSVAVWLPGSVAMSRTVRWTASDGATVVGQGGSSVIENAPVGSIDAPVNVMGSPLPEWVTVT
jgi:hypothetical protein